MSNAGYCACIRRKGQRVGGYLPVDYKSGQRRRKLIKAYRAAKIARAAKELEHE